MAHLTCVNATRKQIDDVLGEARARGIANILALRGDPPVGQDGFRKVEGGFEYSLELVAHLRELGGFCIGTAGFPEGHIRCQEGKYVDWERLKAKIDCGADFVLTQLFFDNADFFEFRDYVTGKLGVTVPIFPGVLPILSTPQIKRFTALCSARLPARLQSRLEALGDDDASVAELGVEYATEQCEELVRAGVPGLHFYTLNKAESTSRVLHNLGLAHPH
jgi:methylenetetrahydrofolate reductase (NADPH)